MRLRFWIRHLFNRSVSRPIRRTPHRFRPALEVLEDRWVPSTFTVNSIADLGAGSGMAGDLRYCITQANSSSGANAIVFDPTVFATAQTITLSGTQLELSNTTGTEAITGSTAGVTVNGGGMSRVFQVDKLVTASISGLAIAGGNSTSNGGGVQNYGSLTMTNCAVSGNSVSVSYHGGGVNSSGTLTLTNCTLSGNSAGRGGGLFTEHGTANLTDCTVSGNSAGVLGGGLFNSYGTLAMTNCTVSGNSAALGGGLEAYNGAAGSLTLLNCTISGNSARFVGGGLRRGTLGTYTLGNTIIAGNTARSFPDTNGAFTSLGNNLIGVASNSSGWLASDLTGTSVHPLNPLLAPLGNYGGPTQTMALLPGSPAIDAGNNGAGVPSTDQRGAARVGAVDIGAFESQGFTLTVVPGGTPQTATIGTAFANPLAVAVTANNPIEPVDGGFVSFVAHAAANGASALLSPSSAVISGGRAAVTALPNNADGSYQVVASVSGSSASFNLTNVGPTFASLIVNTTSDSPTPGAGLLSLREAVAFSNLDSSGISTITFDKHVFATPQMITLTGTPLELSNTRETETITGPKAGVTVNGGGLSRVFQVDANVMASISGLTIDGGSAVNGGGLASYGGTIALTNCTVSGNSASTGNGGGLYCSEGTATLIGCTVSGNIDDGLPNGTINYGGGGVAAASSTLTLTNCTVSGNSDPHGNGGGVFSYFGTTNLTGCIVNGNSAAYGGGLNVAEGKLSLTNCSISGNTTSSGGGGLQNFFGTLSMTNCTISANSGGLDSGGLLDDGTTTLTNCTISGNSAQFVGGLQLFGGNETLTNCTISGNSASGGAGGLGCSFGTATLTNCTVSGNSTVTGDGGGVWISTRGTARLTACAISGNSAASGSGGGVYNGSGGTATLTNCTVSGNSSLNGGGVFTAGYIGYNGSKYYSATTLTNCTVSGNTAAANGGGVDNASLGNTTVTGTNVSKNSAVAGGGISNQGTLNVASSIILKNTATTKGGGISTTGGSATITNSVINTNQVNSSGTALGGGIDCENSVLSLTGCTVNANRANGATALGGGIYALDSTVDIANSVVNGNRANGSVLGEGGGIYSSNSSLTLMKSIVKGNKATTAFDDIFGP